MVVWCEVGYVYDEVVGCCWLVGWLQALCSLVSRARARELKRLGGDTDLYYKKHGFNGHPKRKGEFVEFEGGRLIHSDVCVGCGKTRGECKCGEAKESKDFNFNYGDK